MDPYNKIMRAYNDPNGVRDVRLTAGDINQLGLDDAIASAALALREERCEKRGGHRYVNDECACGAHKSAPTTTPTLVTPVPRQRSKHW